MFLCHSIYFVDNQQHDQRNGFDLNLILLPSIVQCLKTIYPKTHRACKQKPMYLKEE